MDIVGSYVVRSNVTSNFLLGRKDHSFLSFQFAKFFCNNRIVGMAFYLILDYLLYF